MNSTAYLFIEEIKPDALKVQSKTGIPAAVMIAQACLETGFGQNNFIDIKNRKNSKNLFGLKGTGPAGSVECRTNEYYKGIKHRVIAKMRAYNTYEESFADYSEILLKPRFAPCMAFKGDPEKFALNLQACGYSTDPEYGSKIMAIVKKYNLENLLNAAPKPVDGENISITLTDKKFKGLLMNGVPYMPVRDILETLGYTVSCDLVAKNINIIPPED